MFTSRVTVKIKKDKKYLQYIKIIREYDDSLSMTHIKDSMEKGEVVFAFDPKVNPIIHNGKDNSDYFLGDLFLKTLRALKKAGADMTVIEGDHELLEFSKVSSSNANVEELIGKLFEAKDGEKAFNAIDKLEKAAKKNEAKRACIIEAMMKYSEETSMTHLRSLIIPTINDLVKENEIRYADYYREKIQHGNSSEAFWAIKGYAVVMQKSAYEFLVDALLRGDLDMECRALIVCELSHLSDQPFDLGSPYELIHWKIKNLRLAEIEKWRDAGYPDGSGYKDPQVHECLREPKTSAEKVYASLNAKLLKRREGHKDKAHPEFWLVQATDDDIEMIKKELNPPNSYLDFLMKASPLGVEMKLKDYGPVWLIGAHDLIDAQAGYALIPRENTKIADLPKNYIVVATCLADPFCIDAQQENSPVYYAMHGMDEWDFEEAFPSFISFLKALK